MTYRKVTGWHVVESERGALFFRLELECGHTVDSRMTRDERRRFVLWWQGEMECTRKRAKCRYCKEETQ